MLLPEDDHKDHPSGQDPGAGSWNRAARVTHAGVCRRAIGTTLKLFILCPLAAARNLQDIMLIGDCCGDFCEFVNRAGAPYQVRARMDCNFNGEVVPSESTSLSARSQRLPVLAPLRCRFTSRLLALMGRRGRLSCLCSVSRTPISSGAR